MSKEISYAHAILEAQQYLLKKHKDFIIMGQGVTSPWYVGATMTNLNKEYPDRIIETPVCENASTSIAFGASLAKLKTLIVHPRMDFMLYATDAIVNQAAKWSGMFGEKIDSPFTVRSIINRGNEQGAQHSQSLQSWFVHVPGIHVVTPYSPLDARDLLISSVLNNEPTIYIDDRWLYELKENYKPIKILNIKNIEAKKISNGPDYTLVSYGYGSLVSVKAAEILKKNFKINIDIIDLRIISKINYKIIIKSLKKTKKLLVLDYAWGKCGIASEIISNISIMKNNNNYSFKKITFPFYTTPTSANLEKAFYPSTKEVIKIILENKKNEKYF